ncbi:hypothetical protein V1279_004193 [Bradyrhizobium sp. AZCC 1610]
MSATTPVGARDLLRHRPFLFSLLSRSLSRFASQFESGVTAALFGTVPAAVLGGVGTIAIALLWMKLFPALREGGAAGVGGGCRVPDAVQRLHAAPQSRDPSCSVWPPALQRSTSCRAASGARERAYPRPTNGILVAMTVMNSTLASSGRPAM